MAERSLTTEHQWAREAMLNGTPRLHRLLDNAIESDGLSAVDVYTIGDWIAPLESEAADCLGLVLVALFLAVAEGSLAVELSADALRRRLDDLEGDDFDKWIAESLARQNAGQFGHVIGSAKQRAAPSPPGTPGHEGRAEAGQGAARRLDVVARASSRTPSPSPPEYRARGEQSLRAETADRHPLLVWENQGRHFLYCQKHLRAEEDLDATLRERAQRTSQTLADADVAKAIAEVLSLAPLRVHGSPIKWDADQLTALGLALLRDLVIISGGPGTGKTSVVLTLLRCLVRVGISPDRIALAAPTGRAAQRLSDALRAGLESIGHDSPTADRALAARSALTLHSLLEYNPGRNLYRRHQENPIPADVVLVDEVSMVSVDQMASLLHALEPTTKLILLGDKDQLPSVEAGAVLGQLVPDEPAYSEPVRQKIEKWLPDDGKLARGREHWLRDSVVLLRTNHRSEQGIQAAARAINAQRIALIGELPRIGGGVKDDWLAAESGGGCWWWPQTIATAGELRAQLHHWAEHVYDGPLPGGGTFFDLVAQRALADGDVEAPAHAWLGQLFQALERTRLLTLVREGSWGCGPINEMMQAWLRRRSRTARDRMWVPGTPILITRNDSLRGLYNGDVGLTVAGPAGAPRVVFARQGGFVEFAVENLPSHELGFALTVHKSQGSEFQQVLVVLPPTAGRRLLTKELLYTAITRAKKLAIVSATEEAFRVAIGRRIVRESGMMGR